MWVPFRLTALTLSFCIESKGIGANLLKKSNKRRRTKAEIEEDKQEEILKRQRIASDMAELAALRLRVETAEREARNHKAAADIMG